MADLKASIGIEVNGTAEASKNLETVTSALTTFGEKAGNAAEAAGSLDSATDDLASNSGQNAKTFEDNMEAAADEAADAFLNVVSTILEVNAAIIATVNEVAAQGDAIAKGAKAIDWNVEAYQEWDFVLKRSGSSMSKAAGAIQTLAKNASTASEKSVNAFDALGLSMEEVSSMKPEELFGAVISGLQGIDDQGLKLDIAKQLFGSYKSLGTLLNSTGDEVADLTELARKLNYVMSEEDVANAEAYQDSIDNMNDTIAGIKRMVVDDLMPGIQSVRDSLINMLTQVDWNGLGQALQLIYEPAVNFLNNFLIPLSGLALSGVAGTIGALATMIQNIKDVLSGDKTVTEALDEMWDYGNWNSDAPEKVLQEYEGLAEGVRNVGYELDNAFSALNIARMEEADLSESDLSGFAEALSNYREELAATAAEAPNAAAATEQLDRELAALGERYSEALLNGSGDPAEQLALYDQLMSELSALSLKYQEVANQTPVEEQTMDAEQAADNIVSAGEKVAEGAATMLQTYDEGIGQISENFTTGTDEMTKAAAESVIAVNDTMAENMATLNGNALIWGTDMMISFANGLAAGWNDYTGPQLEKIAQAIADMFEHSEPKKGPLANDSTWMPDMMQSFADGIEANRHLVLDQIDTLATGMRRSVSAGIAGAGAGPNSYNYGGVSVSFNVPEGMNGRQLYEEFTWWLQNDMNSERAVFAQ